jgi:NADPH2:quinone reductase
MRAWLLDELTGLDGLRLAEVPDPQPAAGEVLLRLRYAALNPADRYLAEGQYPARPRLPHILGRDGLGTAIGVGQAVTGITLERDYAILRGPAGVVRPGTFAEYVALPAEYLVAPPTGWTPVQAACAALAYLTAWQALTADGPPPPVVLVTGASGGVGIAAIQLAWAAGCRVVALTRGRAKQQALREAGAELVCDITEADWADRLKARLKPDRVGLVIDNIGGDVFNQCLATLGDQGRVSCVGRLAGPVPQFNTGSLLFRRLRITGISVGAWSAAEAREAWERIVAALAGTGTRPVVDSIHPFTQLPAAFARLAAGPLGKVVLKVAG